jgi:hypothetical protein
MRLRFLSSLFVPLVCLCACDRHSIPPNDDSVVEIAPSGAWCWFQDPRAIYVSHHRKRTYTGWVTKDGKLQIGAYDHVTGQIEVATIKEKWEIDDHNSNSFLVLPDHRLMIFYAKHNGTKLSCRTTSHPEDISQWDNEVTVSDSKRITYNHPVYLSDEKRFYVFWRGDSWKPTFATSPDGVTWTAPQVLLQDIGREAPSVRPYFKVASDGKSEIHFAFTDGHPNAEPENSIYYLKYKKGTFYKADGSVVGSMDHLPIPHRHSDLVYNGKITKVRSWVWDLAVTEKGNPVIAYTQFPKETDHRYHYACWNNQAWVDTEITPGGKWFPHTKFFRKETEPYYSGGIGIDHDNPSIVYLSKPVDGIFEIEKWTTSDLGQTWTSSAITKHSKYDNVRPVVPVGHETNVDSVLWMNGPYVHYLNFNTSILMSKPPPITAQEPAATDARPAHR